MSESERSSSSEEGTRAPVQRGSFGASERRPAASDADKAPVSSTELRDRGPAELAQSPRPRVNWVVFLVSSVVVLSFSVWAIMLPAGAAETMKDVVGWIATNLGWFYVLTVTLVIGFVLRVALGKEGSVRLGPDHSRPQYSLFTAQTGSEDYDIMGLTRQQVIDDVIDRYEAHLAFLQYSTEHDYESVLTPPVRSAPPVAPAIEDPGAEGAKES